MNTYLANQRIQQPRQQQIVVAGLYASIYAESGYKYVISRQDRGGSNRHTSLVMVEVIAKSGCSVSFLTENC